MIDTFNKFSTFNRLQRTFAYVFRFIYNLKNPKGKLCSELSPSELKISHDFIIKTVQVDQFPKVILDLQLKRDMKDNSTLYKNKSSPLRKLSPFLDSQNLLRVGGRIKHANVQFSQKHPLILPCRNHITYLIIKKLHYDLFHSGIQNTLANLRLQYWPINGKTEVRKVIHSCVICVRYRAQTCEQKMSLLPYPRVNFERPFLHVGVDFGGPIYVKASRYRTATYHKGYLCLFICLSTRAIHLELVSDLTTKAFILALKRFISRRGLCHTIYSDNATNFKGAHNELNELYKMFINKNDYSEILNYTAHRSINWKFTVPLASHMGGIYEAGIKSAKHLLRRQLGNIRLPYEELNTILIQIEGILNSRPLCALSNFPNDLTCLTPAHFLIGTSIMEIPEPDLTLIPESRLSVYQKISRLKQQFWNSWHKTYLSELQTRAKWLDNKPNLVVNDLVLIKDENLPPSSWSLGRILKVYLNKQDDLVRSALVRTQSGEYHRPISKLILLPINQSSDL